MKKLIILFCLLLAFVFADWDVDPDFSEDITIEGDLTVSGDISGSTTIRGTDTFGGTKTADTVLISGATASDYYWIQIKGSTITTSPFVYVAKIGSLIVNCAVADTTVARASGYNWLRVK